MYLDVSRPQGPKIWWRLDEVVAVLLVVVVVVVCLCLPPPAFLSERLPDARL